MYRNVARQPIALGRLTCRASKPEEGCCRINVFTRVWWVLLRIVDSDVGMVVDMAILAQV